MEKQKILIENKKIKNMLYSNLRKFPFTDYLNPSENNEYKYKDLALTVNKNLEAYGYCLPADVLDCIANAESVESITNMYNDLLNTIKEETGYSLFSKAKPYYANFPEEVMSKSEFQLYMETLAHYVGHFCFGADLREYISEEKKDRPALLETSKRELKLITNGTEADVTNLIMSKIYSNSMTDTDYENIKLYLKEFPEGLLKLNTEIENKRKFQSKENLAKVCTIIYKNVNKEHYILDKLLKNSDDVLRFGLVLANPDHVKEAANLNNYSKKDTIKLNFKLKNHAAIVKNLLNKSPDLYTTIWKRKELWRLIYPYLNITDKEKTTYIRLTEAFNNLFNNKKVDEKGKEILSDNARYDKALISLRQGDVLPLKNMAEKNFGLFSKNFVTSVNNAPKALKVEVAEIYVNNCLKGNVSPVDVLKIKKLLEFRHKQEFVVDRNKMGKAFIRRNPDYNKPIDKEILQKINEQLDKAIFEICKNTKEPMGNVYIDPKLKGIACVERNNRDSSAGLTMPKYSRIKSDKNKNLILFGIHWPNGIDGTRKIDLDLASFAYDENFRCISRIAYGSLTNSFGCHSGDCLGGETYGESGSIEAVIIDKELAKAAGVRYISTSFNSYSSKNIQDAESVHFIRMEKEGSLKDAQIKSKNTLNHGHYNYSRSNHSELPEFTFNGELVELSHIEDAIRITANTSTHSPCIYDVEKEEYIWVDEPIMMQSYGNAMNPLAMKGSQMSIYKAVNELVPDLKDIFEVYTKSNKGQLVDSIEEADTIFLSRPVDISQLELKEDAKVITAFETDKIAAEFCTRQEKVKEKIKEKEKIQEIEEDIEL